MAESNTVPDWWRKQRTNFVYVAIAAGLLCFLWYSAIWETFYGSKGGMDKPGSVLLGIGLSMLQHLLIWVPFLGLEIWSFRFLPKLDARLNPGGNRDHRLRLLVIGCVAACFLPMLPPTILVFVHG
ncbi:MAG: hypothetical protein U0176_15465 [Bacteroidia bacterium]